MEKDYFANMLELYNTKGIQKNIFIYGSAYKYTDLCIWEYNNRINFSTSFVFFRKADKLKERKEFYGDIFDKNMKIIYETGDYATIRDLLSLAENEDYKEAIEGLSSYFDRKELVLTKGDK